MKHQVRTREIIKLQIQAMRQARGEEPETLWTARVDGEARSSITVNSPMATKAAAEEQKKAATCCAIL